MARKRREWELEVGICIDGGIDLLNAWIVSSMELNSWAMDADMLNCFCV